MSKFDQRYQEVGTQVNINIEADSKSFQADLLKGLTYVKVTKLCQSQIKNEISIALGTKYIPSLYVDRHVMNRISNFIDKRPKNAIPYTTNAMEALRNQVDVIRARQAKIKERELSSRSRSLSKNDERDIENLSDSIDEIKSLIPSIENLAELLRSDNIDMEEIRAQIDQIEKHAGCIDSAQAQINRLKQNLRNTLVLKDMAGRGKTNLMCALATLRMEYQPTFLLLAGTLKLDDKYDLERYIQKSFGISENVPTASFFDRLSKLAKISGTEILFIVDAINENKDSDLLKSAIHSLISRYSDQNFKFIFTCRDIYWEGFLYTKDDFWDDYIFEQISLGDFTDDEFSKVLPLYLRHFRIKANFSSAAIAKLRNPLLLRFFCEAYHSDEKKVSLGNIDDIRLKQLFDIYWKNKIESIKSLLKLRSTREIENFLFLIARKMRFSRDRSLTIDDLTRMTGITDFDSRGSIFTSILDEGIILEQTPSGQGQWHKPRVTFVYDEFMEYVMAKDILHNSILSGSPSAFESKINKLTKSAKKFSSIYGVLTYLLPMLESEDKVECWKILFSRGVEWYKTLANAMYKVLPNDLSIEALEVGMHITSRGEEAIRKKILLIALEMESKFPVKSILLWFVLLLDPIMEIRLQARDALIRLFLDGYRDAIQAIELTLKSPYPEVRGTAIYALAELGECDVNKIYPLLNDEDGYVREATVYLISSLGEKVDKLTFEKVMRNRLADSAPQVRLATIKAIEETGNSDLIRLLLSSKRREAITFVRKEIDNTIDELQGKRGVLINYKKDWA